MARTSQPTTGLLHFPANSPELERLLGAGYGGMDREMANTILAERKANPAVWPFDMAQKAKAFLAALDATPQVIAVNKRPWRTGRKVRRSGP